MQEEWRAIPGYVGMYEVSNLGRVRSLDRVTHDGKHLHGQMMRPWVMPTGHIRCRLAKFGKHKTLKVHRLVLLAFVGPPAPGNECLHVDGDPSNNALANLRWGTKSENCRDQIRHGTHPMTRKTHCPQGHPYTPENTYRRTGANRRSCRTCTLTQQRNSRIKKLQNREVA